MSNEARWFPPFLEVQLQQSCGHRNLMVIAVIAGAVWLALSGQNGTFPALRRESLRQVAT